MHGICKVYLWFTQVLHGQMQTQDVPLLQLADISLYVVLCFTPSECDIVQSEMLQSTIQTSL